jgi:subtilisin-like proprotein convertase family protein
MEHDHPDLEPNYDADASTDLNGNDDDPYPNIQDPINKHGTRCSGEVGAVANNNNCGVGIAYNSKIGAVRMLDGDVSDRVEASSLSLAPQHIDIYTNSWGPNDDGRTIEGPATLAATAFADGIKHGRSGKGSIYIFASGNGGSTDDCNGDGYANAIYTIAIGGIDEHGNVPYYSENCAAALASTFSSGSGRSITTTDLHGGCTSSHSGTSAAAPIGAGILALVLEARPDLTWRDVQYLIVHSSTCKGLSATGWYTNAAGLKHHHGFGFGSMDADAMVSLAENWTLVPAAAKFESDPKLVRGSFNGKTVTSTITIANAEGVAVLEHVQVHIELEAGRRGSVLIDLTCPSGTPSKLLSNRQDTTSGKIDWTLMTVRCWGEPPTGTYTLKVQSQFPSSTNKVDKWRIILHGTMGNDTLLHDNSSYQGVGHGGGGSELHNAVVALSIVLGVGFLGGVILLVVYQNKATSLYHGVSLKIDDAQCSNPEPGQPHAMTSNQIPVSERDSEDDHDFVQYSSSSLAL